MANPIPAIPANAPVAGQIVTVQVLRAIAALTVAFGHAQHEAAVWAGRTGAAFTRETSLPWGAGVDLFFVISGFIMVHASTRLFGRPGAWRDFLLRRLIRIIPLYWLVFAAFLILALAFSGGQDRPPLDAGAILASFLFWPADIFGDGYPRPVYTLGWTLNYEMAFYVVFAAFIGLERRGALAATACALLLLVILGASFSGKPAVLAFWSQPIVLEFVLGMVIAAAFNAGLRLSPRLGLALVIAAIGALWLNPAGVSAAGGTDIIANDSARLVGWGLPSGLILAGAVLSAPGTEPGVAVRTLAKLGDASYALYLTHPFAIVAVRKIWLTSGGAGMFGFWPMVLATLAGAIVLALVVHHAIERPMTEALRARLERAA